MKKTILLAFITLTATLGLISCQDSHMSQDCVLLVRSDDSLCITCSQDMIRDVYIDGKTDKADSILAVSGSGDESMSGTISFKVPGDALVSVLFGITKGGIPSRKESEQAYFDVERLSSNGDVEVLMLRESNGVNYHERYNWPAPEAAQRDSIFNDITTHCGQPVVIPANVQKRRITFDLFEKRK